MIEAEETGISVGDAAEALSVNPSTLRGWEEKYGFPPAARTPGGHRRFNTSDIESLACARDEGLPTSLAISRILKIREKTPDEQAQLSSALESYDCRSANNIMEQTIAISSLHEAVNSNLLPAARSIGQVDNFQSARWFFAGRWASEWMSRVGQSFYKQTHKSPILIGDANDGRLNQGSLETSGLEFFARHMGFEVVRFAVEYQDGISDAASEINPSAVVLAGSASADTKISRWTGSLKDNTEHPVGYKFYNSHPGVDAKPLPDDPYSASRTLT